MTLLRPSEIRWPCVPEKVTSAFWPGVGPIVTVSGDPPGVIEAVTSGGTSYRVSVAEPTSVSCGSTRIVYVPLTGSVFVSTKPPLVPNGVAKTSVEPSGLRMETRAEQHVEVPIVTFVRFRLMRRPATPSNRTSAFWPGVGPVVTVTGAPPGVMVAFTSGGTSYSVSVIEPVDVAWGSTRIL